MQADIEEGRNVFEEGSNFTLQALEQQVTMLMAYVLTADCQLGQGMSARTADRGVLHNSTGLSECALTGHAVVQAATAV